MSELEKQAFIFGTIFVLANKLQILGDAFDENITIKQWLFLTSVAQFKAPPTLSEAADYIGYSRQNAKRLAVALAQNGFVIISKDQNDARAMRITLTPKSQKYFKDREEREEAFIQELFEGFDTNLTNGLYQGLYCLEQNIKRMEKENEKNKEK